ncbi:PREDICTED: probable [Prunus dulcis]|uniref:PREDICTED: probable n=1 Tax=Prunus dulcis TaxID=3755 RepID=A0A5E4F944_PRUDU|nr:2-oxoglutarate-dependent dioxygenase AOP3-like [Prunus dulcis]VVA22318.1 PREDICTED: probable [Prunus dulcis]
MGVTGRNTQEAKIPVVDFSKIINNTSSTTSSSCCWAEARAQVCQALEEYGCFVATLSDADADEYNKIFGNLDELFGFPKEIKLQNTYDKPFRGYHSPNDVHEGLGIDDPTNPQAIHNFANLFWPSGNHPNFSESADGYAEVVVRLDETLTRMIFEHYGVDNKLCESHIGATDYVLRLHKYDGAGAAGKEHMALPEHTDMNLTTIIHQNHVNGLEVKIANGEWVPFDASPNSFIFMTGDGFQVWSNDRIKPCVHRVMMRDKEVRYSVLLSTFHSGTISVPEELIDDQHPLRYKPLNHLQYLASQLGQNYRVCVNNFCGL